MNDKQFSLFVRTNGWDRVKMAKHRMCPSYAQNILIQSQCWGVLSTRSHFQWNHDERAETALFMHINSIKSIFSHQHFPIMTTLFFLVGVLVFFFHSHQESHDRLRKKKLNEAKFIHFFVSRYFIFILFSSELNYYCIQALIKPYNIRISFIWHW